MYVFFLNTTKCSSLCHVFPFISSTWIKDGDFMAHQYKSALDVPHFVVKYTSTLRNDRPGDRRQAASLPWRPLPRFERYTFVRAISLDNIYTYFDLGAAT